MTEDVNAHQVYQSVSGLPGSGCDLIADSIIDRDTQRQTDNVCSFCNAIKAGVSSQL
jgi:hypothetical protein